MYMEYVISKLRVLMKCWNHRDTKQLTTVSNNNNNNSHPSIIINNSNDLDPDSGTNSSNILRLSMANNSPKKSLDKPFFSDCKENYGRIQIAYVDTEIAGCTVLEEILWEDIYHIMSFNSYNRFKDHLYNCHVLPDIALVSFHANEAPELTLMCKSIRVKFSASLLPILVVTTMDCEQQVSSDLLLHGINDYILKPLRKHEVVRRLKTHLIVKNDIRIMEEARLNNAILSDIFPEHIIKQIKVSTKMSIKDCAPRKAIAETHDCITVLFSDIVGFTKLASEIPIINIVYMLNEMFSMFDDLCEKHGVYKVETIGDAYMIVCGHDHKTPDHAIRIVEMGFAMLKAVRKIRTANGKQVQIRVGVNSGPAYSGVIGKKRIRYAFFGDTINTASRMESTGMPGKLHISESTFQLVKENKSLYFEKLPPTDIKGKGMMTTYFVHKGESLVEQKGTWYF
jgi:class 3 adenylate cyclase